MDWEIFRVWLDKRTYVLASAAVIAAAVLGWLSGVLPGAFAGVLAAFAGLVPPILWEATKDRRDRLRGQGELLANAQRDLVPPQILQGGVARYLRPEEAVVDFWPRPELEHLKAWLVSDRPADICLVTGEGGTGKTRLALQLAEDAAGEYSFNCYWVKTGNEEHAADAASAGEVPALLVVDYAETRDQLEALLDAVVRGWSGPNVRVLMLARSAGEWWEQLAAGSDYILSEVLAAVPVTTLGPLSAPSSQGEVFHQALKAFSTQLQAEFPPTASPPPLDPNAVALVVHAAALLTVLNHNLPHSEDAVMADPAEVISGLLRHEARYWEQSQASYQLSLGPAITRRAVAVGTLIGADDEASAIKLLAAIPDLAHDALRGKVARWLHDLYPSIEPGTERPEWICPLRPDPVAEKLVTDVLQSHRQFIPALFTGLDAHRAVGALTVLAEQRSPTQMQTG